MSRIRSWKQPVLSNEDKVKTLKDSESQCNNKFWLNQHDATQRSPALGNLPALFNKRNYCIHV